MVQPVASRPRRRLRQRSTTLDHRELLASRVDRPDFDPVEAMGHSFSLDQRGYIIPYASAGHGRFSWDGDIHGGYQLVAGLSLGNLLVGLQRF